MTCGIYCIENKINGKKYIGQSENIEKRSKANHTNSKALLNAFKKYGKENFIIYIVKECSIEKLDELEKFYIKSLHTHMTENGYNISWGGEAPMRGLKHSEETKKKMSEDRKGENNPLFGKPKSEEHKRKLSEGRIGEKHWAFGTKHSPETIEKMKRNNKRAALGKVYSEEEKEIQSERIIGKNKSRKTNTKYKGVTFHKASKKWRARIYKRGNEVYLGLFLTDIEAAKAYDEYCWNRFHDKKLLNFPEDHDE